MKLNRRDFLTATIAGVAMLGSSISLSSLAADKTYRIGYSQFWGTNKFLRTQVKGAEAAIAEWKKKGVDVQLIVTNGGDTDTTKQVADLEDLYAQHVDGLLIFPGDSIVLSGPVQKLYNANKIPVVVTDIGLKSGDWVTYVDTDNELGGRMAAEYMASVVQKGAKVVVFDHGPAVQVIIDRNKGFEKRASELGLKVLPRKVIKLSLEDGRRTMEDTLTETPDIAGVFFQNYAPAIGAAATLQAMHQMNVKLVNFDTDPTAYKMVRDGVIAATIVQDPYQMGYAGMNAMLTHLTGGKTAHEIVLPPKLMTRKNADEFANNPQVLK
jgi:ribose transport system substrate-binding protein